jgi:A/G-specific adenine glycosylase
MVVDMSAHIAHKILAHFSTNARDLPWRNPPGRALPLDDPNWPYRVWLSEVMLQQTTVAAVTPYFEAFTARWPSVTALAAADDAEVMAAWAGLGYYARARNLLACARVVAAVGGQFPQDEDALRALPGIGAYTAAAIAAFAFGKRAVVVDGNIERVIARLFAIATPMPAARPEIYAAMDAAGDFAQGLMDLARSLCTPRNPRCILCPVMAHCAGKDAPETYPVKPAKTKRPERSGTAWWIECDGEVLLIRRPEKGLLGGMRALPSGEWNGISKTQPPCEGDWHPLGTVTHIFTHFRLTLNIQGVRLKRGCKPQLDGEWWNIERLDEAGLPSLFAKAAVLAMTWEDI